MLLLDLGNSSIKAQCWQGDKLLSSCRIAIKPGWQAQFEHYLLGSETRLCYYAGVPGSVARDDLRDCLYGYFESQNIIQMQSQARCGNVVNAYPDPPGMGVDRWLAMLAANKLCETDVMVVDAGSAITIDLLKSDGRHLGGAILPGFNLTLKRFKHILAVADFDHADIGLVENPGYSTESCIHINYDLSDTHYLKALINRWFKLLDKKAMIMASGGDASRISELVKQQTVQIPDLVFQGMRQQLECAE